MAEQAMGGSGDIEWVEGRRVLEGDCVIMEPVRVVRELAGSLLYAGEHLVARAGAAISMLPGMPGGETASEVPAPTTEGEPYAS